VNLERRQRGLKQSTRRLSINLDDDVHRAFKVVAASESREMTEIVPELIQRYVSQHQPAASEYIHKALAAADRSKTKTSRAAWQYQRVTLVAESRPKGNHTG
jgi:hypothetical protein